MNKICNSLKKTILSVFMLCMITASGFSLAVPALQARVNDYAGLMSAADKREAEIYLETLEENTGIQIAVLTIKSLEGESLEAYSMKVCERWKLGQKGEDNGALLLVSYNDHAVRIETGYGLEGLLTDTKSGLIIRNVIIPEFRNGNFSAGILKGVKNMGGVASDNAELVAKSVQEEEEGQGASFLPVIIMLIWLLFVISGVLSRKGMLPLIIWSMTGRHGPRPHVQKPKSGGTSFNNGPTFRGGGFGGGFGGGGGFSGGGGSFGGGGASGRW